METFLCASKLTESELTSYQTVLVVLGNPTCDLDSAMCALVQGYLEYTCAKRDGRTNIAVIPVMNIPKKEFYTKTEVIFILRRHGILLNLLTFRDQINLHNLAKDKSLQLILVDHHTLSDEDIVLKPFVQTIIDHRPMDPDWHWSNVLLDVFCVGSCATLVARNVLERNHEILDIRLASLLRVPILVDTDNMSDETGQATPMDVDILNTIERLSELPSNRTEVFKAVMRVKTDISGLKPEDLMIKDLKVTNGIPIVGFPLLVQKFLKQDNAKETIEEFASDRNCTVVVLIGQERRSLENRSRDIAVFSTRSDQLGDDIIKALTSSTHPKLKLELIMELQEEKYSLHLYRQRNEKITRKRILPIVREVSKQKRCK